jgi:hypothetical protein
MKEAESSSETLCPSIKKPYDGKNNCVVLQILLDSQALLNPVMRTSKGQLMTPLDAALHRGNRGCAKYLQLHGGVPASKLTDKSARARGGNQRSVAHT